MTNAEFYKSSHQLANYCFDQWCQSMLAKDSVWCVDPTACEICHARWYTLEFDQSAHDAAMKQLHEDHEEACMETNEQSEARYAKILKDAENYRLELARDHGWDSYAEYKAHNFEDKVVVERRESRPQPPANPEPTADSDGSKRVEPVREPESTWNPGEGSLKATKRPNGGWKKDGNGWNQRKPRQDRSGARGRGKTSKATFHPFKRVRGASGASPEAIERSRKHMESIKEREEGERGSQTNVFGDNREFKPGKGHKLSFKKGESKTVWSSAW